MKTKINAGDLVKDNYGEIHEVWFVDARGAWVGCNRWIHLSNIRKIAK